MKIRILSRPAMERLARAPLPQGTAVISIADWGLESAQLDNSPEYLLQVAFDDVDNDIFAPEADALTDAQIRAAEKSSAALFYVAACRKICDKDGKRQC